MRRTLEGMPGVERLLFDLPQRLLTISHREVSADALEQALNSVGMKAQAVRDAAVSTTYASRTWTARARRNSSARTSGQSREFRTSTSTSLSAPCR
ncbi:hypothetical protein [Stenotrophomonas maltophilia]|uniref:hypothetical protein n=1 Tax=Stenotrophomonas maltophilia TaxID=40324 RepID=UPI00351DC9B4